KGRLKPYLRTGEWESGPSKDEK
ncbi:MAG: hypothetical protein RLZZ265_3595, partial [Verrucomicrobiota bacterium]